MDKRNLKNTPVVITESKDKIFIECSGLFEDLDNFINICHSKGFENSDITIVLRTYNDMHVSIHELYSIRGLIEQYATSISNSDDDLTKFVKSELSIRNNFSHFSDKKFLKDTNFKQLFMLGLMV